MNALSRREEETLLKATKARALKECDPVVKGCSVSHLRENVSKWTTPYYSQLLRTVQPDGRYRSPGRVELI